ncbi:MAG: Hsp20 family protein [Ferruginibacter sp.]|nr:Hsp20 family protein [Cytophagales bacterium]
MKIDRNLMGGFGNQIDLLNTLSGGISMATVNVSETPQGLTIRIKTPSLGGDAYNIEVNNNQLVVYTVLNHHGRLEFGDEENAQRAVIPSFIRTFPLPSFVDKDHIEAAFEEGELKVIVPLQPRTEEKPRRIDIRQN